MAPSARLAEFRGALPRTAATGVVHSLFCQRITEKTARALLAEGFQGAGIGAPTHVLFCTVRLARDKNAPRCLFNCYLALSELKPIAQDWVAAETAKALRESLFRCRDVCFLIRCNTSKEFPWCLTYEELDQYWILEIAAQYRYFFRKAGGVLPPLWVDDDDDPTQLQ